LLDLDPPEPELLLLEDELDELDELDESSLPFHRLLMDD